MPRQAKTAVESVLASGPADLLARQGFTKKRLHFYRCDEAIWKHITFEVDRFHDGGPVVAFDGMASATSIAIHDLLSKEPFPKNPAHATPSAYGTFLQVSHGAADGRWEVPHGDSSAAAAVGKSICEVLELYVLPYLERIRTVEDVGRLLEGPAVDAHSTRTRAAVHLLHGRQAEALHELVRWRSIYKSGSPEDQLRMRRTVEEYGVRLGLQLPPDDFVPVSEHQQLLERTQASWAQLGPSDPRYEHAEKLLAQARAGGEIPPDLRLLVEQRRAQIWPNLSIRHLCRFAVSLCHRARSVTPRERQEALLLARTIFEAVTSRGPIPEQYLQAYEETRAVD